MIRILVINCWIHEKNRIGLEIVLNYLFEQHQIEYKIGKVNDIPNYDVVFSVSQQINTAAYPNQKFIFGPHFSTFPNHSELQSFQSHIHKNSIYIQPSEWVEQLWRNMNAEQIMPIRSFPFPVNTTRFNSNNTQERSGVFLYYKQRNPQDLNYIKTFLDKNNINYKLFDYNAKYNENDYITSLQKAKYGIWVGRHESQGFALEEALACNVPLLVWDAKSMNQEYGSNYNDIPATTIPYWDDRCGEVFYHSTELLPTFQRFQAKLITNEYSPRQYILDNLSTEKCAERFMDLIKF